VPAEPPTVTIDGPACAPYGDVLASGSERTLGPLGRRRLAEAVVLAAALLVAGSGAQAAADLRAEQAAELRRAGALVLSVVGQVPQQAATYDPLHGTAEVAVQVPVRNDGPRPVLLVDGRAGPFWLAEPVSLPAGGTGELVLRRSVTCTGSAPAHEGQLRVSAQTGAGVRQATVELPAPLRAGTAAGPCAILAVDEAVVVTPLGVAADDGSLAVAVDVHPAMTLPVALVDVVVEDGFRAGVDDGHDGWASLPMPVTSGGRRSLLRTEIAVTDCTAARRATQEPGLRVLRLRLRDHSGRLSEPRAHYDAAVLRDLVARACP
jgi:hypothetical protein